MDEFSTTGCGQSKKIARKGVAEQMMATLPEEWKQNRLGGKRKRPAGGSNIQPSPKKKPSLD